jgi:hypothetical protein
MPPAAVWEARAGSVLRVIEPRGRQQVTDQPNHWLGVAHHAQEPYHAWWLNMNLGGHHWMHNDLIEPNLKARIDYWDTCRDFRDVHWPRKSFAEMVKKAEAARQGRRQRQKSR